MLFEGYAAAPGLFCYSGILALPLGYFVYLGLCCCSGIILLHWVILLLCRFDAVALDLFSLVTLLFWGFTPLLRGYAQQLTCAHCAVLRAVASDTAAPNSWCRHS